MRRELRSGRRLRSLVVAFALLAALLCVTDGGQCWQDDCHASGAACAEGGDPCEMLQALLSVKPTSAIVAPCVVLHGPAFTELPRIECHFVSVERSTGSVDHSPPLAATRHPRPPPA